MGAFSLNNWKTTQANKDKETQILRQLKEEYEQNLIQLDQKIDMRKYPINSVFKILEYKKSDPIKVQKDSLNMHLFYTIMDHTFDPSMGT